LATPRYTIDLHSHSTCSDGALTPAELVRRASERGVERLALTDHDTVSGIAAARDAGAGCGVSIVAGVEISAFFGQEIHVLGYFMDADDPNLVEVLARQTGGRVERVRRIADRLARLGLPIDVEAVLASADGNVGRPHVAQALIDAGHVPDFEAAFTRLLGKSGAAYIPASRLTGAHAIRVIHDAGGAAVLAHPGVERVDEDLPQLVDAGLDGLEIDHPAHDPGTRAKYAGLAKRHGLVSTGGSDFHRPEGRVDLGDHGVSAEALAALEARSAGR